MYGTKGGGGFGMTVGNGASFRCPRLTANRKNPFSARYLMCHALVTDPAPIKNAATASVPITATGVRGPIERQNDRRMDSLVLHRSPSVRRKVTYWVTRSLIFTAGPPSRSPRRFAAPEDRPWRRCGSSRATDARGDRRFPSATALGPASAWHRRVSRRGGHSGAKGRSRREAAGERPAPG